MSGNLRREHIQHLVERGVPPYLSYGAYFCALLRSSDVITNQMLIRQQVLSEAERQKTREYQKWVDRKMGDNNCKYCGQLYPREKFYGGCPSCGAPHE